jgi:branched-subunit amino acid transport protein
MTLAEIGPYLALILVGFLPNEVWRVLGLVLVRRLSEDSQIIVWVRAVATAILAAVMAQLIMTTTGALAAVPLFVRISAAGLGFGAFLLARRSVFVGVLVGELIFFAGAWFYAS